MQLRAYAPEPSDKTAYTAEFDRFYTRFAHLYELIVKVVPFWRRWISQVLPYVQGPRILEVSFGTGYLLDQYEPGNEVIGLEYNQEMIGIARRNVQEHGRSVSFAQADVSRLPFRSGTFDTVVNTMAFTGYPDGKLAMAELNRVLRVGGKLVMVDIDYPRDGNRLGVLLSGFWMRSGDILRDMAPIFQAAGFECLDEEIGGWGSVHLYLATKVGRQI